MKTMYYDYIACDSTKEAKELMEISKNAKIVQCQNCNGRGWLPVYAAWGRTCRNCNGKGWQLRIERE